MNFGKLLLKEIDRKRKTPPPPAKKKLRREKSSKNVAPTASDALGPISEGPHMDVSDANVADGNISNHSNNDSGHANINNVSDSPENFNPVSNPGNANNDRGNDVTVSGVPRVSSASLDSISDEKLLRSIAALDSHSETLSKEEQLHKLEILVRRQKKNARYSQYLELENTVPAAVDLRDIGTASSADVARRLTMQVRKFIKQIVQMWQADSAPPFPMSLLDETKRDVVRLMYKLRSEKLAHDVLVSLCTIVYYIQTESFAKANEAYMKLSIGNVAWPIGVRDVGIHARAADAKITGDDKTSVANIMQNEKTRRWIIAVKRLLNYCEHSHRSRTP